MLNFIDKAYIAMLARWNTFIHDEEGDVNIVSIVVIIGIVIVLAVLFRKQLAKLINTLFSKISTSATNAIDGAEAMPD